MGKIIILSSAVIILIITSGFIIRGVRRSISSDLVPTPTYKTFKSTHLNFSLELPASYVIKDERATRTEINKGESKIYVDRTATDFNNLEGYFSDLDRHNKTSIINTKSIVINNNEVVVRTYKFGSNEIQKEYTFLFNGWIYNLFTNNESSFSDLDQIAQSFKYEL